MKKEHWLIKNTQHIYSGEWLRLRVDTIVQPNGQNGEYSVVELKGGVGIVAITSENKIVMVGQYRYAPDVYSWEIPKGGFSTFESQENPIKVAQKELKEETGIIANEWREITVVHTLLGSTNDKVFLFLATNLQFLEPEPDETENITMKQVTFSEFYDMVKKCEVTDATSIAAVALVEKKLTT